MIHSFKRCAKSLLSKGAASVLIASTFALAGCAAGVNSNFPFGVQAGDGGFAAASTADPKMTQGDVEARRMAERAFEEGRYQGQREGGAYYGGYRGGYGSGYGQVTTGNDRMDELYNGMEQQGYAPYRRDGNNVIFRNSAGQEVTTSVRHNLSGKSRIDVKDARTGQKLFTREISPYQGNRLIMP